MYFRVRRQNILTAGIRETKKKIYLCNRLKSMRKLFRTYWKTCCVLLLILYASTTRNTPDIGIAYMIPYFDKVVHFCMYAILAFTVCYDRRFVYQGNILHLLPILLLTILYGIIMELLQEYFFPPRTGSFYDCLANSIGSIAGCGLFLIFNRLNTPKA